MRMPFVIVLISVLGAAGPSRAATAWDFWTATSRLNAHDASQVLLAHTDGKPVLPSDLFEAEKHLRTDGGISASELVLADMLTRMLASRARQAGNDLQIRVLPPVLHWLQGTRRSEDVEVRGETVQLAVLSRGNDTALTVLLHRTLYQDWRLCDGAPCFTPVKSPLRTSVSYVLTAGESAAPADAGASSLLLASELTGWLRDAGGSASRRELARACDPFPSEATLRSAARRQAFFRHTADRTFAEEPNQVLCMFHGEGPARGKISYLVSDTLASPPASAARSAITNNPLDFELFETITRWR